MSDKQVTPLKEGSTTIITITEEMINQHKFKPIVRNIIPTTSHLKIVQGNKNDVKTVCTRKGQDC